MSQLTNETLLRLTANMPMKQINLDIYLDKECPLTGKIEHVRSVEKNPYLQRYYAGTFRDGADLWLHRFLSNDGDSHVHNHPFDFHSVMLCGGYTEEYLTPLNEKEKRKTLPNPKSQLPELLEEAINSISEMHSAAFGSIAHGFDNTLDVYDWHRIASVQPETWTAVIVKPKRLPKWFFKDDDGELRDMRASPRDWWKDYKVRPECGIAGDDNRV